MLSVAKRIGETDQALRRDRNWHRNEFIGHELQGMTVGIIGLGHTGSRLAELCGGALGMRVLAYDPYIEAKRFTRYGSEAVSLDTLLGESDVVSLNCPLSDETRKMIDAAALARMRRGSILVSTARGGIHDENALYDALRDGHLYGAGLDVWEDEPPTLNHPLLSLPNVIASPHTAGVTVESRRRISLICAEQWLTIWRGEKPPRLLNPEAWPTYEARRLARAAP
jgi:D-3-phosphoglycerate dehydrogenase